MPSYTRRVEIPGKTSQEIYDKVSTDIDQFVEKLLNGKGEITRSPERKEVKVKSTLATAVMLCEENGISFDVKLSLIASPFRSKLDQGVDRWVARTFGVTVP